MTYSEVKNASRTANVVHEFLTKRERNRKVLNLKLLAYNINVNGGQMVVDEYTNYFKGLEAIGAGKLIMDNTGFPVSFAFTKPLLEVIGVQQSSEAPKNVVRMPRKRSVAPVSKEQHLKTVLIGLRKDLDFSLNLPYDFSQEDAERIFKLLKKAAS